MRQMTVYVAGRWGDSHVMCIPERNDENDTSSLSLADSELLNRVLF